MPASYPTTAKTWPTINNGDTVQAAHPNELHEEVTAIEQDLVGGLPVARGGTGAKTLTDKGVLYGNGTSAIGATAVGTAGQVLTSNGAGVAPTFQGVVTAGSWTPVLGGSGGTSGQTYGTQTGRYIKVGQLVTAWFRVGFTAKGTITGNLQIQGLPFTVENTIAMPGPVTWEGFALSYVNVAMEATPNTTTAAVYGITAAAVSNRTDLATAAVSDTSTFIGTLTYLASA